jgi:hypothetical protein
MKRYLSLTLLCLASTLSLTMLQAQPLSFAPRGIGGGGALFFPTINPGNDNEYYVACDMSELFHTTDFGQHYDQVDFQKLQCFNTSTYEFTNNPQVAYSNFNDGNEGYPVKTTDGGATWLQMTGYDLNNYGNVYKMSANYANPNQLLIAAYGDILISNDGGASFTLVKHATNMGAGLIMAGVLWDGQTICIGTNEGILRSLNGGTSFAPMGDSGLNAGEVIWSFAAAKTGNTTRFACITADVGDVYNGVMPWEYYAFAKGVYVMDNLSGTWVSQSTGINFANDFIMYVGMAQNDITTMYLAGNDDALGAPLVFKSTTGGTTWTKKFNTSNNANIVTGWEGHQGDKSWGWSEACFGITVAPNNSSKVIFPTYSNVQVSSDAGENWRQAYVDVADQHVAGAATPKQQPYHSVGLENTTCWQVFWADSLHMMGCFSDIGGIRSTDGGTAWGFSYSGFSVNSLYRMVRGADGNLYGGCSNIHDMYQSTRLADAQLDANDGNGKIVYSTDNGATWANLHVFNHPVFWLATDPNNANRMYASVIHYGGTQGNQQGGIYVTQDLNNLAAATWTKLPNPPRTQGHPASIVVLDDGSVVCTFSGRRAGGAFTASSGVYVYNPTGGTWADVSDPGMHYWTKDIVLDPTDATQSTWLTCVFSGWGGAPNGLGGLYRTTNRGTSWTKLTGTQFDRVTSVTFNPQNQDEVYLTTETQGLWVNHAFHAPNPMWSLVGSYIFRQPERVYFNPYNPDEMWVSSFGNGMKVGSMSGVVGTLEFAAPTVQLFPNPNHGQFTLHLPADIGQAVQIQISDMAGRKVYSQVAFAAGKVLAVSAGNMAQGMYVVRLTWEGGHWAGKMVVE